MRNFNTWVGLAIVVAVLAAAAAGGCAKKPKLRAVRATMAKVESSVTTTTSGTVYAQQQAVLGFGSVGRVKSVETEVGARVKQGQILAELENVDLRTVAQDADRERGRAEKLFKAGLVSRAALDEAKRNFEVAKANLDKTIIRAPFDGIITDENLEVGELTQNTPTTKSLLQIIDLKPRIVKGDIDEVDLSKMKEGLEARVKVPAARSEPFTAVVQRVVPFVSTAKEQDRTSRIELRITDPNFAQIPVGASADIEVITAMKEKVLAIPARVVLGHGDQKHVFQVRGGNSGKLERTAVKTGIGNYSRTEIVSGLVEGSVVIYPPEDIEIRDGLKVDVEILPWP